MQRILGKTLSFVALTLLGAVATPACTDEDGIIYIRYNLAPPTNRSAGCVFLADPQAPFQSSGKLDAALAQTYEVNLLIGNQMIARGDATSPRAETNRVHLDGAVVRVTDVEDNLINEFTSLTSGFAEASTSNTPGYGVANIAVLDAATVAKLNLRTFRATKLVLAHVKVFGKTIGGVDVETAEWTYPIQVGYGTGISFYSDTAQAFPNCGGEAPATTTPVCRIGQDESINCKDCLGNGFCDGVFPTP